MLRHGSTPGSPAPAARRPRRAARPAPSSAAPPAREESTSVSRTARHTGVRSHDNRIWGSQTEANGGGAEQAKRIAQLHLRGGTGQHGRSIVSQPSSVASLGAFQLASEMPGASFLGEVPRKRQGASRSAPAPSRGPASPGAAAPPPPRPPPRPRPGQGACML